MIDENGSDKPKAASGPPALTWEQLVELQVPQKEAGELIRGQPREPKK